MRQYPARHYLTCAVCGASFDVPHSRPEAKWCSKACWAVRGQRVGLCRCGKKFQYRDNEQKIWCTSACMMKNRRGELAPHYKGGISLAHDRARDAALIRDWRQKVLQRDEKTCQECGSESQPLHAHHIKGWKEHPLLRFSVDNGRTLCVVCHNKEHGRVYVGKKHCLGCGRKVQRSNARCMNCYIASVRRKNVCLVCSGRVASAKTKRCLSCVRNGNKAT